MLKVHLATTFGKNVEVLYYGKTKKRLVKAELRKARRTARSQGYEIKGGVAFKSCGSRYGGFWRQYSL